MPSDTASRQAPSKKAKHPELFLFLDSHLEDLLLFAASDTETYSQQIKCWPILSHPRPLCCIQALSDPNLPFQTLNHPLLNSRTEPRSSVGSAWRENALCGSTQV